MASINKVDIDILSSFESGLHPAVLALQSKMWFCSFMSPFAFDDGKDGRNAGVTGTTALHRVSNQVY